MILSNRVLVPVLILTAVFAVSCSETSTVEQSSEVKTEVVEKEAVSDSISDEAMVAVSDSVQAEVDTNAIDSLALRSYLVEMKSRVEGLDTSWVIKNVGESFFNMDAGIIRPELVRLFGQLDVDSLFDNNRMDYEIPAEGRCVETFGISLDKNFYLVIGIKPEEGFDDYEESMTECGESAEFWIFEYKRDRVVFLKQDFAG